MDDPQLPPVRFDLMDRAQSHIEDERCRQEVLKAQGRFAHTAADADCGDQARLSMLVEEVGEVARALQRAAHDGDLDLYHELTQTAAICVAWMEYLLDG